MNPVRILIVDDSQIHLEGLKLILKPHDQIEVIGETNNSRETLDFLQERQPDVAVIDISLEEETDGIELAHEIRRNFPGVKIIFLTHYKSSKYLVHALKSGASGYLAKDIDPAELVHAIHSVCQGKGVYLGDTIPVESLLDAFGSEEALLKNKPYDLTAREIEIIDYLARGYSTKELAARLNIEVNTVESHKERIKEKLGVNTVIQIVVQSLKKGIISLES